MVLENTLYYTGALTVSYLLFKLLQFFSIHLYPSRLHRYHPGKESDHVARSWALVTGASDGIGYALAYELCQHHFNVVLHGRNLQKLQKCQDMLYRDFPLSQIRIVTADASSDPPAAVEDIASSIQDLPLTILINNVGGTGGILSPSFKTLNAHTKDEVDGLINVNDRFPTQLTRVILPTLVQNQPALIMNISSQTKVGIPYLSVYSGTKGYIDSWSKALGAECKGQGYDIEVLCMSVGAVQSQSNKVESTSLFIPSSKTMAKAALSVVGCKQAIVTGYLPHALQEAILDLMPGYLREKALLAIPKAYISSQGKEK